MMNSRKFNLKSVFAVLAVFAGAVFSASDASAGSEANESAAAVSQGSVELGPAVGEKIPHDLHSKISTGASTSFDELVGDKGLVLFFVRSVDWCPYCRQQAVDVNSRMQEFTSRGLEVAFVSYDAPTKQTKFVEKWTFSPTLISDQQSEIINAFGLLNTKHKPGSRFYGIPHPVVFVITPDREIAAKLYEEDYAVNDKSYRDRPAIDAILAAVDTGLAK